MQGWASGKRRENLSSLGSQEAVDGDGRVQMPGHTGHHAGESQQSDDGVGWHDTFTEQLPHDSFT